MNKLNSLVYAVIFCTAIFISSCDKENTQNEDQQELAQLLTKIRTLAESSRCGDDINIQTLAFGDKACGGPSSYVAYTNTINVQELEKLAANYTDLEIRYNQKWSVISDCALVGGPKSVNCNNGKLQVIY